MARGLGDSVALAAASGFAPLGAHDTRNGRYNSSSAGKKRKLLGFAGGTVRSPGSACLAHDARFHCFLRLYNRHRPWSRRPLAMTEEEVAERPPAPFFLDRAPRDSSRHCARPWTDAYREERTASPRGPWELSAGLRQRRVATTYLIAASRRCSRSGAAQGRPTEDGAPRYKDHDKRKPWIPALRATTFSKPPSSVTNRLQRATSSSAPSGAGLRRPASGRALDPSPCARSPRQLDLSRATTEPGTPLLRLLLPHAPRRRRRPPVRRTPFDQSRCD